MKTYTSKDIKEMFPSHKLDMVYVNKDLNLKLKKSRNTYLYTDEDIKTISDKLKIISDMLKFEDLCKYGSKKFWSYLVKNNIIKYVRFNDRIYFDKSILNEVEYLKETYKIVDKRIRVGYSVPWTIEEDDCLSSYVSKYSISSIQNKLNTLYNNNRSREAIIRRLQVLNISVKKSFRGHSRYILKDILIEFNLDRKQFENLREKLEIRFTKNHRMRYLTIEEYEKIKKYIENEYNNYLSTKETSEYIGVPLNKIKDWIDYYPEDIPYTTFGRNRKFLPKDLDLIKSFFKTHYTVKEYAEKFFYSEREVYRKIQTGKLLSNYKFGHPYILKDQTTKESIELMNYYTIKELSKLTNLSETSLLKHLKGNINLKKINDRYYYFKTEGNKLKKSLDENTIFNKVYEQLSISRYELKKLISIYNIVLIKIFGMKYVPNTFLNFLKSKLDGEIKVCDLFKNKIL